MTFPDGSTRTFRAWRRSPKASARITNNDWRHGLGNGRRIGDWTAFFAEQVTEVQWREVLATWWPRLLLGIPVAPAVTDPAAEVLELAAAHGDEHVIKFADTAAEAYARSGDRDALAAAVHASQLLEPRR